MNSGGPPVNPYKNFTLGARVFAVFGVAFTVAFLVTPEGPMRWLELMIATVCLIRAVYHFLKAGRIPVGERGS